MKNTNNNSAPPAGHPAPPSRQNNHENQGKQGKQRTGNSAAPAGHPAPPGRKNDFESKMVGPIDSASSSEMQRFCSGRCMLCFCMYTFLYVYKNSIKSFKMKGKHNFFFFYN